MLKTITSELKAHVPYTGLGAASAVVAMALIVVARIPARVSEAVFDTFHPAHVVFSALATTAMYRLHVKGRAWAAVLIGYTGAVGIATLSDAVVPFLGGKLLGVDMQWHLPFIEGTRMPFVGVPTWVTVNAAAVIGVAIGLAKPTTKIPHLGHVLLSTWASLFAFTAFGAGDWLPRLPGVFVFLFLAVWLPCCASDIIYPLLWAGRSAKATQEK